MTQSVPLSVVGRSVGWSVCFPTGREVTLPCIFVTGRFPNFGMVRTLSFRPTDTCRRVRIYIYVLVSNCLSSFVVDVADVAIFDVVVDVAVVTVAYVAILVIAVVVVAILEIVVVVVEVVVVDIIVAFVLLKRCY